MEDSEVLDINIFKYIEMVLRQWRLIFSVILIFAVVSGLVSFTYSKSYEAKAVVASTKVTSTVEFGSAIQTLTEEQLLASGTGAYGLINRDNRLRSYVRLVENPDIAQVILDQYSSQLSEDERNVSKILKMVQGNIIAGSDSIEVIVTHEDPELAASIANTWAQEYVKHVNFVYSGSGTKDSYAAIVQQIGIVRANYEEAQAELVDFKTTSQIAELTRQLNEKQQLIDSLSEVRGIVVTSILSETVDTQLQILAEYYQAQTNNQVLAFQYDQAGRQALLAGYIDALNKSRVMVFTQQSRDLLVQLEDAYNQARQFDLLFLSAQDMRDQVQQGGLGAVSSNAVALTMLKAQVYAAFDFSSELQFQINPSETTVEAMVADLDALIEVLQARRTAIDLEIQSLSEEILEGGGYTYLDTPLESSGQLATAVQERFPELFEIGTLSDLSAFTEENELYAETEARARELLQLTGFDEMLTYDVADAPTEQFLRGLEQDVRDLDARLVQENDREAELTRARDLAWETYSTLATKEAELAVAVQTTSTEVAFAAPAVVSDEDSFSRLSLVTESILAGFILGLLIAFSIELWWDYKKLVPYPLTPSTIFQERSNVIQKSLGN